jgi:hypothetical protein
MSAKSESKSILGGVTVSALMKIESLWALVLMIGEKKESATMEALQWYDLAEFLAIVVIAYAALMKYFEMRDKVTKIKVFRDQEMRRVWAFVKYYRDTSAASSRNPMTAIRANDPANKSGLSEDWPVDYTHLFLIGRENEMFKKLTEDYNKEFESWGVTAYEDPFDEKK